MILEKFFKMTNSGDSFIYCPNISCSQPRNPLGHQECQTCKTPLLYRYVWAVGSEAAQIPSGTLVNDRYQVISSQIWLETKPAEAPYLLNEIPEILEPYLYLYPHRLHTPQLYGFCQVGDKNEHPPIVLLDNIPVEKNGQLSPSLPESWSDAPPIRQIYWLWQIWQLWEPLLTQGVATSLLVGDNLRVQGGFVRLREFYDQDTPLDLQDLAQFFYPLCQSAVPEVQHSLLEIYQLMSENEPDTEKITHQFNQLLLEKASELPLSWQIGGATDPGPERSHNEDSCYPLELDNQFVMMATGISPLSHVGIVCDGVGGHEGGEVASQMAVQSLKPLLQNLLTEITESEEITSPQMVTKQLSEIVRVINNVLCTQNDSQGRELRQRMATTLVMAVQVPQKIVTSNGVRSNSHELYLVNVGDSRAYWITDKYCQCITLDDDVATREVRMGRSLYWEGLKRVDGGALTQALGARAGDYLYPQIQRFIIEENGVLLLCSDGLSDNDWVEKSWMNYVPGIIKGEISLEAALQLWINLANEKNGHDNTSIVLAHYRVSPEKLSLLPPLSTTTPTLPLESELSEASKALLYAETEKVSPTVTSQSGLKNLWLVAGLIFLLFLGVGLGTWWQNRPIPPSSLPNPPQNTN